MKWFNQTLKDNSVSDVEAQLASILASGVNLSLEELLQYQSKASLINLNATRNQSSRMSGNYLARSKGRGMEFDEVRHYQTGDDIRTIDWRVTARTGKTHTKLFREEIERPVLIATDLSKNMLFGSQLLFKSVQAAHLAALVAWHAKVRGDRLGGIVFNDDQHLECKPRSRKQGVLHYLHNLLEIHQAGIDAHFNNPTNLNTEQSSKAFEENCARIRQLARPGSLVYLITDGFSLNEESVRHLASVSQHCELIVCQIFDPIEHELPSTPSLLNVALTDGQSRQTLTLGDIKSAQQYAQHALTQQNMQKHLFTKAGARLLSISAGQTLEQQLTVGAQQWIR